MDLRTSYLGLGLRTPIVPSASPLSEDLGNLKRMEDAGAAAIVFHSVFEEQIRQDRHCPKPSLGLDTAAAAITAGYFPRANQFHYAPEEYLRNIARAREALGIPIIGSLNGSTFGGWTTYARSIEQAGAHALELNLYSIPVDPELLPEEIEMSCLSLIASVKAQLKIPVAVKLSPFFTNFGNFAHRVDQQGADGLVLFNRFYQPDIDLKALKVVPNLNLSSPGEIRLPLRWIAILYGRAKASLAATGGVHRGGDAFKLLLAGADVTMVCSALLREGIEHLRAIESELSAEMERHGFSSVAQCKGLMSQVNCPDRSAFERAQYMRTIATERVIQVSAV